MFETRLLCCLLSAALLLSCVTAQGAVGRSCTTPNRQQGVCRLVAQCPSLNKLLEKGNPTEAERRYLRESLCSFIGSAPVLCCPSSVSGPAPAPAPAPAPIPQAPVATSERANDIPWDSCGPTSADRIVGGNKTVVFEMPWIVRLGYRNRRDDGVLFKCGGSLITNRYVLTAAHCYKKKSPPVLVRLGEHDLDKEIDCSVLSGRRVCAPPAFNVDVETITVHPGFSVRASDSNYLKNDIALLRLAQPVEYSYAVRPICLATTTTPLDNLNVVIAGWGKTAAFGYSSRTLLKAFVPVIPHDQCAAAYRQKGYNVESRSQICAGAQRGIDSCNGDSGGPLTRAGMMSFNGAQSVRELLYGVVSFGLDQCGTEGVPAVYTRVSEYLPWIRDNMKP